MDLRAKDLMNKTFITISPNATIREAVETMKMSSREKGRRIFGLMVANEERELVGMIAMYDILFSVRPASVKVNDASLLDDWEIEFEKALKKIAQIKVSTIMTKPLITITEDTHIMEIIDIMIKKHLRRIPVLEGKMIVGIVYISDVFFEVYKKLLP